MFIIDGVKLSVTISSISMYIIDGVKLSVTISDI